MTYGRRDDFAEIRAILSQTAQRQAENTVAIAELRQGIVELRQSQAENTVAITELRQTQSENLVAIAELRQGLSETRQICDSNARSLEAMQSRIDGSFDLHERMMQIALDDRQQWREQRQGLIERYGEIADEQDDTRQSIQNLLEDARADRLAREQERLANEQEHQAFRESLQTWLQEAHAERLANEQEHKAFREIVRSMLAEMAQIWQRLAS